MNESHQESSGCPVCGFLGGINAVALHIAGKILYSPRDTLHKSWALSKIGDSINESSVRRSVNTLGAALKPHVEEAHKIRQNQQPGVKPSEIKPSQPYSNLVRLREILRSCEKYIWWVDNCFNARGLEELIVCLDPAVVRDVRILSGPANVNEKAKRDFERFRKEWALKGIQAEWRVSRGFAHDRFIMGDNVCYLVTSVDIILRGNYAQMLLTPNRPPFEEWWVDSKPLRGDVMADTEDLVTKRKEAYKYIKDTLHQHPWRIPLDISDAQLADVLGGRPGLTSSLSSLRAGEANPTKLLVEMFKDFVKQVIAETEVNQKLVDPFK